MIRNVMVHVQSIMAGKAQGVIHLGPRQIAFEVECCDVTGPVDRETFVQRLRVGVTQAVRHDALTPHHERFAGVYHLDIDMPSSVPPPIPHGQWHHGVLNIEVFGNTHHVLVRSGDRELRLIPNKHRNVSIAGLTPPCAIVAVASDGAASKEVVVP